MKKILFLLILSPLFLGSCAQSEIQEKKFFETSLVGEGYISSKDSILATAEGSNVSNLSFKNPGRIQEIFVKKGDRVKKGQILAKESNEEANISYNGAGNILNEIRNMGGDISSMGNDTKKIRTALGELYDGKINLLERDAEKSKINISLASKDLDLAKSNLKSLTDISSGTLLSNAQKIQQTENALSMAKNNLENSKKLLESENMSIQKNAVNSLTNAYIIARNARDSLDTILGITDANRSKNDTYETYLGAKKSSTKNTAEDAFRKFDSAYAQTYQLYNDSIVGKANISKDTLITVLTNALSTLESLRESLHSTKDMLDNSISSSNFSEDTLSGLQNQISLFLGNLELSILSPTGAGVKGSMEAIESFSYTYSLKIKQLEDAVSIASEDVNLAKTGKDISSSHVAQNLENLKMSISTKEDSLSMAEIGEIQARKNIELARQEKISKLAEIDANLSEIRSKLSEVGSKKAEVQMNVNMAANSLESGIIKAPFDGIVLDKNYDIGTVVGGGMPILRISSNTGKYLKIYMDNAIYGLLPGSEVRVKNEKSGKTLTGTVLLISQTPDLSIKKNYTEIQITNESVQIGERFLVLLGKEKREKQIIIPLNSLVTKYEIPGVYVLENNHALFRIIKIKEMDDSFVAVEGLKIGETLITQGKDNILDGEELISD